MLFGTLDIEGDSSYYIFLNQSKTIKTWILTTREIFDSPNKTKNKDYIIAVVRSKVNGALEGYGKTFILTRLITDMSFMLYSAVSNYKENIQENDYMRNDVYRYEQAGSDEFIEVKCGLMFGTYRSISMYYDGFRLSMDSTDRDISFKYPKLYPIQDEKNKAVVTANLGIKTAASLFRQKGKALDWFKKKDYRLVDTDEKLKNMLLEYLRCVQIAADNNKTVWTGIDTETTGLQVLNLSPDNPIRDHVVAVPFSWEDNKAYLICTDMCYFSNVSTDLLYSTFDILFRRNDDFSFQDIEIEFEGEKFKFNRKNITTVGWNVMFDEMAFFSENCNVFFDEDGRQLFFNLDTDFVQGAEGREKSGTYKISNSLKSQTRRLIGDETLELEDLFGKGHEDKFRYLQDEVLSLIYGGADADYTRLVARIGREMTEPLLYKQYRKYDMTTIYQMAKANWNGMPIDTEAVKNQASLIKQDLERIKDFIYHFAWVANHNTLTEKTEKIQQSLGFDYELDFEDVEEDGKMFKYPFTPRNHKRLLFGVLGYPIIAKASKTGEPALDKFVLNKLMEPKRNEPVEILKEDVYSLSDPNMKLIDKELFNKDAYPLARVFSTYATLNKEYTSYYKPIQENDMEGRMFYGFTLARAATRRILSPGQTLKGSLKSLVVAPKGQLFMSFDASQIEYRHMASLAYIRSKHILQKSNPNDWEELLEQTSVAKIHKMMQKEEADYHIETASSLTGTKQHEITPKVRKQYKSIGFGIPYGLGDRALCSNLFKEVNDDTMQQTRELLRHYKEKQKDIIDLLESTRDSAFVPARISDKHREYLGVGKTHVGLVRNFTGFYRIFVLEELTRARTGRIRRQAGNCIIQGGAAELFRRMLYNFQVSCVKYGIHNKVHWLMTVHDELDATVDADIDIMLLIKVLYENCTLRYEDHIPYYIGINFGYNWYDAKADANELPVIMVERMVKAYDEGRFTIESDGKQPETLLSLKRHYMCDRIKEELKDIIPELSGNFEWTDAYVNKVDLEFSNYVVRSYLDSFSKSSDLKQKLIDWQVARDAYGFDVNFLVLEKPSKDEDNGADTIIDDFNFEFMSDGDEDFDFTDDDVDTVNWFGEDELLDSQLVSDSIMVDNDRNYVFVSNNLHSKEDYDFVENNNPQNAFDVYVSNKYKRTKVLSVGENSYSILTAGTAFVGKEKELYSFIKSQFSAGPVSITVIGNSIYRINSIACTEDNLDTLDKMLNDIKDV